MDSKITPKVSVLMPVYNGEIYIEQALESLLAQSEQDWELVVVDDGSTDSTPQILAKFNDARIKVVHQKNSGEACARNAGLEHAQGKYIAFLDADDFYFPNALEDLSSFLDLHPEYGVAYSNGQICDSNNQPLMTLSEIRPGLYTGKILDRLVISSNVVTVPVCTMTRRSVITEHSVQFDRNLIIGPDWDFWIQLAVYTAFGYLDSMTCNYRIHNTNITRTVDQKKRRMDQVYGRLKVMNSDWFEYLSPFTKDQFFYDLLVIKASGNSQVQSSILRSKQFSTLPKDSQAYLLRMVGIDVLQSDDDKNHASTYFQEALAIDPGDRKTRLVYGSLKLGRTFSLAVIRIWRILFYVTKSFTSPDYNRSRRLRKLFGLR
jgi:glycosyltransferase involved in cell wall biosynthesis